jgi:hypothetical protein
MELLRPAAGSTCEILPPGFDGKGLRAMRLPHRTTLCRRIMGGQTNLARKVENAGIFLDPLNWILCHVLSLNSKEEFQVGQMLLQK